MMLMPVEPPFTGGFFLLRFCRITVDPVQSTGQDSPDSFETPEKPERYFPMEFYFPGENSVEFNSLAINPCLAACMDNQFIARNILSPQAPKK